MKKIVLLIILFVAASAQILAQPNAQIRTPAEWEPALGTLITWPLGIPQELVLELAEDDILYTLVGSNYELEQARDSYEAWNVNIDNCEFIMKQTDSHWTRDWGPISAFDGNGDFIIIDPIFNGYPWVPGDKSRDWEQDDNTNQAVAAYFDVPVFQMPAYFTGGNQMTDGYGNFFSTVQMYSENENLMTQIEFLDITRDYLGMENFYFLPNIEDYGIQHIDCGAKLLDEETVLIKKLPEWHPEYQRMEALTDEFRTLMNCFGREYKIHRINCEPYNADNDCAAYTNSLILNNKVYVPTFGISADEAAIEKYRDLMPGYEVIGFDHSSWYYYDALHCRTRAIYDPEMLALKHRPFDSEVFQQDFYTFEVEINDYSNTGIVEKKLFYKISGEDWEAVDLEFKEDDLYNVDVSGFEAGDFVEYYISAKDNSNREETLPRIAPQNYFSFEVVENTNSNEVNSLFNPIIYPNPFSSHENVELKVEISELRSNSRTNIALYNIKGQRIFSDNFLGNKYSLPRSIIENRSDGVYLIEIRSGKETITKKIIIIK